MTASLYDFGRDQFLGGSIDWATDDIRVILVDTDDYTVNLATDQHLDDVPGAARVATAALANESTDGAGTADADDLTFSSVSGDQFEAIVIYQHTGTESTSILIGYDDTLVGLPFTPSGSDITITWDAAGIFTL